MRAFYLLLVLTVALVGCTEDKDVSTKAPSRDDHVWKEQVQALEKAKAVEKTLQDAAARQRDAIYE